MSPRFEANGWQAVLADQFTFASLRLVSQALCNHIRHLQSVIDNFPPRLVVGFDNRFMGQHFAEIAAEVILQNGLDVFLADRAAPTPVVSWMISDQVTTGALVLTGADEAYQYNGVKFITSRMAIASEDTTADIESEIERLAQQARPLVVSMNPGEKQLHNPKPAYFAQLDRLIKLDLAAQACPWVSIDYLHGVASGYLREVLRPWNPPCELHELQNAPLTDFGGLVPTLHSENLGELQTHLRQQSHSLSTGLVLDADGSNLLVLDADGMPIDHSEIFALLLDYLVQERGAEGGIVKPVQKHDLPERVAAHYGLPLFFSETSDFRVITTQLVQEMAVIASDGLGGYAYDGHIMERDGILTALLLMELLSVRQRPLRDQIADLQQL